LPEEVVAAVQETIAVVNESPKQESEVEEEIEEEEEKIVEPQAQPSPEIEKTEVVQESQKCTTPQPSQPTPSENISSIPTDVVDEQNIEVRSEKISLKQKVLEQKVSLTKNIFYEVNYKNFVTNLIFC
jgi:hypothetical protein